MLPARLIRALGVFQLSQMKYWPKKYSLIISSVVGVLILGIAVYLFIARIIFFKNSEAYEAPIAQVSYELVRKGKTRVMAYVPMVEVPQGQGINTRLKVDTFNEEPTYKTGDKLRVVCNLSLGCIEDTFIAKWSMILFDLLLSLLFFSPLLYTRFIKRGRKESQGQAV